jgi:hypothetical protein
MGQNSGVTHVPSTCVKQSLSDQLLTRQGCHSHSGCWVSAKEPTRAVHGSGCMQPCGKLL